MKNPNGYGSVYKLSGKRRNPFAVRVTAGWEIDEKTGKVKQLYDNIGYYKSRQLAMIALAEYNKDPYDIDARKITFQEIFERWGEEKFKNKPINRGYRSAFNLSESLHKMTFIDIRKSHMQAVIDNMNKSHSTKKITRTLFNQLYKFALENDITDKNHASFIELGKNEDESTRKPFDNAEIKKLWDSLDNYKNADMALIMIYTGLRPSELLAIEIKNIHIDDRYMIGGMKTEAGKDRVIPINKKIQPLIRKRMNQEKKYLFLNSKGNKLAYNVFRPDFISLMEKLKMNHKPHDSRHTFATLMDNAGANKISIQKIMGHASQGITDKVYTHKNIEELKKAIDLI